MADSPGINRWQRRGLMARKTSFYYSFLVLPPEQRRAIIAVWDFCRAVDDAVDEPPAGATSAEDANASARQALCAWRRELSVCYDGGTPQTIQGQRLQPFITCLLYTSPSPRDS